MDPIACILATLTGETSRAEASTTLRDWYANHGHRPTLDDIEREAASRSIELPPSWRGNARRLGATGV